MAAVKKVYCPESTPHGQHAWQNHKGRFHCYGVARCDPDDPCQRCLDSAAALTPEPHVPRCQRVFKDTPEELSHLTCSNPHAHLRHQWFDFDTNAGYLCSGVAGINTAHGTAKENVYFTYTTKDSGKREEFPSGMRRDTQDGKPRFDLVVPKGVPYPAQMLTRWADLMARGANKYGDRNWEKGNGQDELVRAKASAFRHFMQWICDEDDEDHAAAVLFNVQQVEVLKWKVNNE